MSAIVQTLSGLAHKGTCYAVPKGTMRTITGARVAKFKVLAPEVDDAPAFIRARGLNPCGVCWPGLREAIEAEREAGPDFAKASEGVQK